MTAYIIRRLIFGAVLIFLSSVVSFAVLKASPGTAIAADFDPRMSAEYREQQKRILGLDRHPVRQYLDWLGVTPPAGNGCLPTPGSPNECVSTPVLRMPWGRVKAAYR